MRKSKTGVTGLFAVLLLILLIPAEVHAADRVPHRVPRVLSEIQVDGVLEEEAWQKALRLEVKYEFLPGGLYYVPG